MISKKLIQSTVFNGFLSSRPIIGVPVDEGDDGVVVTVSAKALRIDERDVLVFIGLDRVVIGGSVGGIIGVDVDMLTEFDTAVVIAMAIALERVSLEDSLSFCFC